MGVAYPPSRTLYTPRRSPADSPLLVETGVGGGRSLLTFLAKTQPNLCADLRVGLRGYMQFAWSDLVCPACPICPVCPVCPVCLACMDWPVCVDASLRPVPPLH